MTTSVECTNASSRHIISALSLVPSIYFPPNVSDASLCCTVLVVRKMVATCLPHIFSSSQGKGFPTSPLGSGQSRESIRPLIPPLAWPNASHCLSFLFHSFFTIAITNLAERTKEGLARKVCAQRRQSQNPRRRGCWRSFWWTPFGGHKLGAVNPFQHLIICFGPRFGPNGHTSIGSDWNGQKVRTKSAS